MFAAESVFEKALARLALENDCHIYKRLELASYLTFTVLVLYANFSSSLLVITYNVKWSTYSDSLRMKESAQFLG